ncbi:hypothetical protein BDE02_06G183700 [Populus trichocarpa]|uniref:Uncharacterized protein n=1 Tax=Populus trichocarpa TaxID=3694 RepID=A0A3N7GG14_POPTR|nr:hypothetical protein BDE02_06G183700 [Populus trichocarpa]
MLHVQGGRRRGFKMATVPGQRIWEVVKKNNSFLVKQFRRICEASTVPRLFSSFLFCVTLFISSFYEKLSLRHQGND